MSDLTWLRKRMLDYHLKQNDLAAAIKQDCNYVSRRIRGRYPFTQTELLTICNILEIVDSEDFVVAFYPDVYRQMFAPKRLKVPNV